MITCRLKGGLGNMMFQIAFLEYEGKKNNFQTGYWNVNQNIQHLNNDKLHNPKLNHATEYLKIFKNFNWHKTAAQPTYENVIPFHSEPFKVADNTSYDGYFQSEQYFPDRNFILNLFQPSEFINQQLVKYNNLLKGVTCSIHVRRGDYLKFGLHAVRDMEYYQKGMHRVGNVDNYLIFSDDLDWCKKNFIGDKFVFIDNEKDYVELFLQSKCTHNIISSSSFSWWGAYLNQGINKKVIGPAQWFTTPKPNGQKENILPERWQLI